MYLLQIDLSDSGTLLFVLILAFLVQCFVLYFIIQRAASAANDKVYQQAFIHNRLLIEQLIHRGISEERITELIEQVPETATKKDSAKLEAADKTLSRVLLVGIIFIVAYAFIWFLQHLK